MVAFRKVFLSRHLATVHELTLKGVQTETILARSCLRAIRNLRRVAQTQSLCQEDLETLICYAEERTADAIPEGFSVEEVFQNISMLNNNVEPFTGKDFAAAMLRESAQRGNEKLQGLVPDGQEEDSLSAAFGKTLTEALAIMFAVTAVQFPQEAATLAANFKAIIKKARTPEL